MVYELQERFLYGHKFESFLDLCFSFSNYFTLNFNEKVAVENLGQYSQFIYNLEPFLVKIMNRSAWYGVKSKYPESSNESPFVKVNIYKTCDEAKKALFKYYNDLFLQTSFPKNSDSFVKKVIENQEFSQDLCFFIENKLLLGADSFGKTAKFYFPPVELIEKLENKHIYGNWKKENWCAEEPLFIDVPNKTVKVYCLKWPDTFTVNIKKQYFKKMLFSLLRDLFCFTLLLGYEKFNTKRVAGLSDTQKIRKDEDISFLEKNEFLALSGNLQEARINFKKTEKIVCEKINSMKINPFYLDLENILKDKISVEKWFEKNSVIDFMSYFSPSYIIYRYSAEIFALEILLKNMSYFYTGEIVNRENIFPKDVCFFNQEGEIVLGTSSDSKLVKLFVRKDSKNQKMYEELLNFPIWEEVEYIGEEDFITYKSADLNFSGPYQEYFHFYK